jgi:hypothetical protein
MSRRNVSEADRMSPPPDWSDRRLVALVDGPRGRWWYFDDDARALRSSALPGQGWEHYVETEDVAEHPLYDVRGAVWRWLPGAVQVGGVR